jgi:hypothetical protein
MGDVADMILDGTLCQECGVIMPDQVPPSSWFKKQKEKAAKGITLVYECDTPGYPRSCDDCLKEEDDETTV